ncbi:MAG: cell division protein SepF [Nanoarchaeota archaeon]|nr:cell division protein SepF [Nanoarchaeota archaeon]
MAMFSRIKDSLGIGKRTDEFEDMYGEDEFVEIDPAKHTGKHSKISVKSFIVNNFEDIKETLNALREGYTIALINIKPLKDKDIVELKRTINKLKKTCDAIEGDIAGISEDWIVVTPAFARVHRNRQTEEVKG